MNQMPLWRDASLLLLLVEQALRYFPCCHKDTLGSGFCQLAIRVWGLVVHTHNGRAQRAHYVRLLEGETGCLRGGMKLRLLSKAHRSADRNPSPAQPASVGATQSPEVSTCAI